MIRTEDIKHLAELARIQLSAGELESMTGQIDSILGYVGQIKEVGGNIEREIPPMRNVMREDNPTHTAREYTEDILNNAPGRHGDYLEVKKILG